MIKKKILILGSTGSIGLNTLEVIRHHLDQFDVVGLACSSSVELLAKQIQEFKPERVCVAVNQKDKLKQHLGQTFNQLTINEGEQGNADLVNHLDYDLIVVAIVGAKGVMPVYLAAERGKNIALANKESIVLAGALIMPLIRKNQVQLYPIDSEHNAIYQSLIGNDRNKVKKIILCATGGPFLDKPLVEFNQITLEDALNHPKWDMGKKITIDSATMMNKALEIIEAYWLFGVNCDQIEVVMHPQALIHSLVEYIDHAIIAQISHPDMKIPISFCLSENARITSASPALDLKKISQMQFFPPDTKKFPTILLAFRALKIGGCCPAFLNGANEALVEAFLEKRIDFTDIFIYLENAINHFEQCILSRTPSSKKIKSIQDAIIANDQGFEYIVQAIKKRPVL